MSDGVHTVLFKAMASWLVVVGSVQVVAVLMVSAFQVATPDYCYQEDYCNPYEWSKTFYSCTPDYTKHHSPIDLSDKVMKNETIPPIRFTGFNVVQSHWTVANVRDTVLVEFQDGMKVAGGCLNNEYQIKEMRFHWGSRTTNGSEHTLNKHRFPMEMQIVGVAPGFEDVLKASSVPSGVTMLGVFIDIGDENIHFKAISDIVPSLNFPVEVKLHPPASRQSSGLCLRNPSSSQKHSTWCSLLASITLMKMNHSGSCWWRTTAPSSRAARVGCMPHLKLWCPDHEQPSQPGSSSPYSSSFLSACWG